MEHSPDVNVVVAFDVEHEDRENPYFPAAQSGKGKRLRVTRRPKARMVRDRPIGGLKRLDEIERDVAARLADAIVDGPFDIQMGQVAREDWLPAHLTLACRTRSLRSVEIGIVGCHCRRRRRAVEQQITEVLPILVGADQLRTYSLLVPYPRLATCSSTKDFIESGSEMFIVLMIGNLCCMAKIWQHADEEEFVSQIFVTAPSRVRG